MIKVSVRIDDHHFLAYEFARILICQSVERLVGEMFPGKSIIMSTASSISSGVAEKPILIRILLSCGILSSLLYVALNVLIPRDWPGYSSASQTVSELSAIGAPTRTKWEVLCAPYTVLIIAFAFGVWKSANGNRPLRIAGILLIAYGVLGILWPFAPMHLRETPAAGGSTFSDTLHITLGATTEVLYLLALGFAAASFGKLFRIYCIITFLVLLTFGALTFLDAPKVGKNLPTPFIGIWERINIGVFLLWVIVLAVILLQADSNKRDQIAFEIRHAV